MSQTNETLENTHKGVYLKYEVRNYNFAFLKKAFQRLFIDKQMELVTGSCSLKF